MFLSSRITNIHSSQRLAAFIWNYLKGKLRATCFTSPLFQALLKIANLVQVWWKLPVINHVITLCNHIKDKVMGIDLSLQVWNYLDTGFVVSLRTKCVYFLRQKTWNLGRGCKIVSNHQHICRCECSHANSLHVICLFSLLSGFTFHTLSSLGVLGTGDLKWLRAERNLREIQLTLCASPSELQLLYSCVVQRREWERKREIGRCWEREKKEGEKRTRERKSRQPWFSVTPPQASCAIFNTQAYVLSNLSCPGF